MLLAGLLACGAPGADASGDDPPGDPAAEERAPGGGPSDAAADPGLLTRPGAPEWATTAPDTFRVRFHTDQGTFDLEVVRDWAPLGADRFYNLARLGFYDDSRFFRVVPEFIAQFGIPGDPRVTAAWEGRVLQDDPVVASNVRGTLAYAMTGPHTRHTQIYFNLVDNVRLDDGGFAPFGRVVDGMDVVDRLYGGYGEDAGGGMRRGEQGRMLQEGNAHLDRDYPLLSRLVRIELLD